MFVVHAPEDDCAATLNPDHGTITESDRVADVDVKLGEGVARTGHVIGGTRVHHPPGDVLVNLLFTQMGKDLLDEVDGVTRRNYHHRWRRCCARLGPQGMFR
jgi:hypothetical protein